MPKPKQRSVTADAMPIDAEPPAGMERIAKKEWQRLVPVGMRTGLFTAADRPLLESYCEQYALVRRLEAEVFAAKPTVKTSQGESENPLYRMHRQSKVIMLNMLKALGCSPTSRQRVRPAVSGNGAPASRYFE